MRVATLLLAALAASAAQAAPPAAGSQHYVIGGVTAERSSMVFVDFAGLVRTPPDVRVPLLLVQRDPRQVAGKTVLYSGIDAVFDCAAGTMGFAAVKTFAPNGALIDDLSTPGPKLPLPAGSSFAATAEVACSGKPRADSAPSFSSDRLAVDYARRLLLGQRPTDRPL
jgi:hypothetical protein